MKNGNYYTLDELEQALFYDTPHNTRTRQAGVLYVKMDNKESKEIGEADGNLRKSPSED